MQKEKDFQDFLQRLIEPDEERRAQLLHEVAQRDEAGTDPAIDDEGRFRLRPWLVEFARREPFAFAIAPISAVCWFWLIGSWGAAAARAAYRYFFGD